MNDAPLVPDDPSHWIVPDWPMPPGVCALTTTRLGPGVSLAPFDRFNLGSRCGDGAAAVAANRRALAQVRALPSAPVWLQQVHGIAVAVADDGGDPQSAPSTPHEPQADASITRAEGRVLVILTADCLPLLLAARDGREVAAVHAGWRGLCDGVIEACVTRLQTPPAQLQAWLGPAIGAGAYEVGDEVRAAFLARDAGAATAFIASRPGHWQCDLYGLARQRLNRLGVEAIYGGEHCTYSDRARFYSYRRDRSTGRMASLIWRGQAHS